MIWHNPLCFLALLLSGVQSFSTTRHTHHQHFSVVIKEGRGKTYRNVSSFSSSNSSRSLNTLNSLNNLDNEEKQSISQSLPKLQRHATQTFSIAMMIATTLLFNNDANAISPLDDPSASTIFRNTNNAPMSKKQMSPSSSSSPLISNSLLVSTVLDEESENINLYTKTEYKDMNPVLEDATKWGFVIYVVFSLLAGVKEMTSRFLTWKENRQQQ